MPASIGADGARAADHSRRRAYVQRVARRSLLATPRLTAGRRRGPAVDDGDARDQGEPVSVVAPRRRSPSASVIGSFALLVALLMVLRPFGLGPFASLMARGKLNDRDKILVADFSSNGAGHDTRRRGLRGGARRSRPVAGRVGRDAADGRRRRCNACSSRRTRASTRASRARSPQREGIKAIVVGRHALAGGRRVRRHDAARERRLRSGARVAQRERRRREGSHSDDRRS